MTKSTREEAELCTKIQLSMLESKYYKQMRHFWDVELPKIKSYEEFKETYPPGSDGYYLFHLGGRYGEFLGALLYEGHVQIELILDGMGGMGYNDTVHMIVEGLRKETDNPVRYENWQYLGTRAREYWEKRKPEPRY